MSPKTASAGGVRTPVPDDRLEDRIATDTIAILARLSRKPVEPTLDRELMADLGYDSLLVLELLGELEEHFKVDVPLNNLTHIRTVGQIVAEVQRLVVEQGPRA